MEEKGEYHHNKNTPEEITRGSEWDENNKAEMSAFILVLLASCVPSFLHHSLRS